MQHPIDAGVLALAILLAGVPSRAQWPADGVPLTTSATVPSGYAVVADSSGGLIAVWSQPVGGQHDIHAMRVTASGVPVWTPGGVPVVTAGFDQVSPSLCQDGSGGAIIVWRDQRSGGLDIYAQRVDAHGALRWTADGVGVCTVSNNQYAPVVVPDGAGGAIVAWYDFRALNYDIYAQHLDANGNALWTGGGIAILAGQYNQYNPMIVSDGVDGAIVAWVDLRNGNADIFARRVTGAGTLLWAPSGVALCTNAFDQLDAALVSDEAGGAIVAWRDARNGGWDVFAQRVDAGGSTLWPANGAAVCTAANDQLHHAVACDGAGGAVIAWDDARGATVDIYAQRMDAVGSALWTPHGVPLCAAASNQTRPSVVCDGASGAIVAWEDARAGNTDLYAQRVDAGGLTQWNADGTALCTAAGEQVTPLAVADGSGGAVLAWKDSRSGNADLYAHRVDASGGTPTGAGGPLRVPGLIVSPGYPNPFARTIRFDVGAAGAAVTMEVFDAAGRRVARRALRGRGLSFDGRDDRGRPLAGGIYFCRFSADGVAVTRKIVLVR
ncbi:MAG TPA: T9SS type A sorting domain-containing protein [Candidatus Krumholzibacteria bacterium]|nr:T9SS type A sorting domain-containing protein [Candidatus Krumholzibacteria bacterium]